MGAGVQTCTEHSFASVNRGLYTKAFAALKLLGNDGPLDSHKRMVFRREYSYTSERGILETGYPMAVVLVKAPSVVEHGHSILRVRACG